MKQWTPKRLAAAARSKNEIVSASAREGLQRLKDDIRTARRFFNNYDTSAGFDLRRVADIQPRKLARLRRDLAAIKPTLASGHTVVRVPKTAAARKALAKHIDHGISTRAKLVPVGVGPQTRVRVTTRGKRGFVRLERQLQSGRVYREQTWYFADYHDEEEHESLGTEEGVNDAYSAMIDDGDLPRNGWFVLVTGSYGNVGAPATMYGMQEAMTRLFIQYESMPGKVDEFIGVRLVGFSYDEAYAEYTPRLQAMIERKRVRAKTRARLRRLRKQRK